ncbi:MAG: hypothetical protein U1E76_02070 [Planctomycetota bacterium]
MTALFLAAALRSGTCWTIALLVWLSAFAYGSPQSLASQVDRISQVIISSYLLTVLVIAQSAHRVLGNRGESLRLIASLGGRPGSAWLLLTPASLSAAIALATFLVAQLSGYRIGGASASSLGIAAAAVFVLVSSSLGLWTLALHLWLEPELAMPVVLGCLMAAIALGGALPGIVDPWLPLAFASGTPLGGSLLASALGLAAPFALAQATIARWQPSAPRLPNV